VRPSVYIRRSKVTISLEPSIWEAFQEIATEQRKTVSELVAEIERTRVGGLSAAIRVYIVNYYRAVINGRRH
jgi:predicted DNA-binding ribbon-helix-helix protein